MMYNAQQFPMGAQSAAGFPGNPNMMASVGPPGMMQNTSMSHMGPANGQRKLALPPLCVYSMIVFHLSLASVTACVMLIVTASRALDGGFTPKTLERDWIP